MSDLNKRLKTIYSRANRELTEKVNSFFRAFEDADKKHRALVEEGKLSEKEYQKWRINTLMTGERYKQMQKDVADTLLNVNKVAASYINAEMPGVYASNFNRVGKDVSKQVPGYSFDLVSAQTVRKLASEDKTLLPYKYVDGRKDERWNTKKVNGEILQGIIQGESIPKIAKRLGNVTKMNKESAIRNARTAITGAQNSGRFDGMKQLEDDGVILKKEWVAAVDSHTREAHLELNGQQVDIDEPFVVDGKEIMFPGDPDCPYPELVYNCRCTMRTVVVGFKPRTNASEDEQEEEKEEELKASSENIADNELREQQEEENDDSIIGPPVISDECIELEERKKEIADKLYGGGEDSFYQQDSKLMQEYNHLRELADIYVQRDEFAVYEQFDTRTELSIAQAQKTDEIAKIQEELESLRKSRPKISDYSDEEEEKYEAARAEYLKKKDELTEAIDKAYGEQTALYKHSWKEIEKYREAEQLGYDGIMEQRNDTMERREKLKDEIEKAKKEVEEISEKLHNEHFYESCAYDLNQKNVAYNLPQKADKSFDIDEVVERLGGGDETEGSCASLGLCYAAQKGGYDVLDFRDGESREYFSRSVNGIIGHIGKSLPSDQYVSAFGDKKTDIEVGKSVLQSLQSDKEYLFTCGRHASIVRKNGSGEFEYLELQSAKNNGWTILGYDDQSLDAMLDWRFAASNTVSEHGFGAEAVAIDVDALSHNKDFLSLMGYVNTAQNEQHKGAFGHEK